LFVKAKMNSHHQSEMSEALRIAVERGHIERVVDLLKRGAPSVLDQEGQTPLHIAASAGHIQLVDALIQAGCDVTVQDFVSHLQFY
jgi:ankyrin repeat protein